MVKENSEAEINRITKGLQDVVKEHFLSNDDPETLTINNIRTTAEQVLKLKTDFFKNDSFWKAESKKVIREEVDKQNSLIEEEAKRQQSSQPPKTSQDNGVNRPSDNKDTEAQSGHEEEDEEAPRRVQRGRKRGTGSVRKKLATTKNGDDAKSENQLIDKGEEKHEDTEDEEAPRRVQRGRKRGTGTVRKKLETAKNGEDAKSENELTDKGEEKHEDTSPRKKQRRTKAGSGKNAVGEEKTDAKKLESEDNAVEKKEEQPAPLPAVGDAEGLSTPNPTHDTSESEMSEVLDLTPQKRKRGASKSTSNGPKKISSKPPSKKQTKKDTAPVSADEEKIKSLQGWLLKCGIRKLWGKELKKFSTPKEKIQHLKGLLEDVGMTGRYSAEKAKRIKEERELAAEVEAVQAGASTWGVETSDKVQTRSSRNAPQAPSTTRRLIRPELAFLDDQSQSDD